MYDIEKLIGKRISEARTNKSLTQEELSERCHISVSTLSRIETGHNSTPLKTLMIICKELNVGLDYVLYDLFPKRTDSACLSPELQEILFLLEPLPQRDLSFILHFLLLYLSREQQ